MAKAQYIKVHVPGEWLWAVKKSKNTALLDNTPITRGYNYKDLVEFDPSTFEVVKVIESQYRQASVRYTVPLNAEEAAIVEVYARVCKALESEGIMCEGAGIGLIIAAVPMKMTDARAKKLAKAAGAIIVFPDKQAANG